MISISLLSIFFVTSVISAAAVFGSIQLARRVGFYDYPDMERKAQVRPIPKLGGLAVAATFVVSAIGGLALTDRVNQVPMALTVLLPALGMALLGFLDDRKHLNPYLRLLIQFFLAAVAWFAGSQVSIFSSGPLNFIVFILWVVVIVNGVNLLDNSDGLAASTVLLSSIGATLIAVHSGQQVVSIMGAAIAGASLGFLWHNWHPARVYLGDAGAYFLGFLVAVLVARMRPESLSSGEGMLVAILLVALPLCDTAYVVVKRMRRGEHPFTAGRDHLSHKLQAMGASVPSSVLALQLCSVICVGLAVVLTVT